MGNRIAHSRVQGAWDYDANNRLIQRGIGINASFYQYDDAGNLIQQSEPGKLTRYAYDTQNRLIEVKDGGDNLIARYGYDPLDRRAWKEQYRDRNGAALAPAKRTYYLYADEGLIAEATQDITLSADGTATAGAAPQIAAQYGPKPQNPFNTGMLFIKTKNSNGQDSFAYYQHDHLQAPIQATDKQGNVAWRATYEPFGKATVTTPLATSDNSTITSNLRLPGQYFDDETGLHYNYRRYYDPFVGRYITSDPIGLMGGSNQYLYVMGNPISNIDPTGLICFNFDKFANDVADNRFDLGATLGTLIADLGVGTMPKVPSELRGLGVPKNQLNPITSQLSRWSGRFGTRALREFGRSAAGIAVGTVATGAVVFEGFYDWSVIIQAAAKATTADDCACKN